MGNLCARLRNRLPEMAAGVAPDMPAEQERGDQRFPPLWQVGGLYNTTGGLRRGSRRFPLDHPPELGRVDVAGGGTGAILQRFESGARAAEVSSSFSTARHSRARKGFCKGLKAAAGRRSFILWQHCAKLRARKRFCKGLKAAAGRRGFVLFQDCVQFVRQKAILQRFGPRQCSRTV